MQKSIALSVLFALLSCQMASAWSIFDYDTYDWYSLTAGSSMGAFAATNDYRDIDTCFTQGYRLGDALIDQT